MSYKETRKYLKGPDKFQKYMFSLIKRCVEHKYFIMFVFLAIFLCICGGITYNLISSKVTSRYQEKITVVDNEVAEFLSSSYFKDKDGKDVKGEKSLSDFAKRYEELFLSKPSTQEGKLVGLKAAKLYLDDKAYDKAMATVEQVIDKSKKSVFHQVEGYFLMLSILEAKKDYDLAINKIESFLAKAPESLQATMMYNQARFYIKKQDNEKANSILASIVTKYPNSKDSARAIALQSTLKK